MFMSIFLSLLQDFQHARRTGSYMFQFRSRQVVDSMCSREDPVSKTGILISAYPNTASGPCFLYGGACLETKMSEPSYFEFT